MFREMRRRGQALSREQCEQLLEEQSRGVLSVAGDGGYPYGMPLNHYYDSGEGKLYFHGAAFGHKIEAVKRDPRVSYCVFERGTKDEGDWAYRVRSVIIFGRVFFVKDKERAMEICRKLCAGFPCPEGYAEREISKDGDRTLVFGIDIEDMKGKRVYEA